MHTTQSRFLLLENGFIDEDEFIKFERWLPLFINGPSGGKIRIYDLLQYALSGDNPPDYIQLDKNNDGQLDQRGKLLSLLMN